MLQRKQLQLDVIFSGRASNSSLEESAPGGPAEGRFNGATSEGMTPPAGRRAMRPLSRVLLLAVLLPFAGCAIPAADDVTPAATDDAATDDAAPAPASPTPTPSTPAPTKPTPSAPNASATPTAPSAPAPPPPPTKVPWNLTGEARLGWVAAVGIGGAAPAMGQTDAERCPDATIAVPAGATLLRVVVTGEPVDPDGPGAGELVLTLTGPDGSAVTLEPAMPDPAAEEAAARELVATAPVAGDWTLHAEPLGPVVQQVWTLAIEVGGESEVAPSGLPVAGAC